LRVYSLLCWFLLFSPGFDDDRLHLFSGLVAGRPIKIPSHIGQIGAPPPVSFAVLSPIHDESKQLVQRPFFFTAAYVEGLDGSF